jgi:polyvinyl alcohol dehydrogenase (cytochrome)
MLGSGAQADQEKNRAEWPSAGQNLDNTRVNAAERTISPENASRLAVKWVFQTAGDVSATPAVDRENVYFPDWGGKLNALDRDSGAVVWTKSIADYTGIPDSFARSTPLIVGDLLVLGTQMDSAHQGAKVLAVNKRTGALVWKTTVDDHPAAVITQSAVASGDRVYLGVSSDEESLATASNYPCCSFRGSMLALNINDGSIAWKTFTVPEGKGFSGVAVWGSTPVLDPERRTVYITTGNNYTVPQQVLVCSSAGGSPEEIKACVNGVDGSQDNHFDSVMALDMDTGAIKWVNNVIPFDAWTVGCLFPPHINCPSPSGPDFDFGQGPALFKVKTGHGRSRHLLGAAQKSGIYWTFDPDTGNVVWSTQAGPGGTLGGLEWGSAVDGRRVYVSVANSGFAPFTFTVGPQAGRTVKGGFWCALDAATGQVLWQMAGDQLPALPNANTPQDAIAITPGAVSFANGIIFAGALDAVGTMYALDAESGNILWRFASGGSVNSGAAIVDGTVYWGSGYANISGTPNNKFYAFEVKEDHGKHTDNGRKSDGSKGHNSAP